MLATCRRVLSLCLLAAAAITTRHQAAALQSQPAPRSSLIPHHKIGVLRGMMTKRGGMMRSWTPLSTSENESSSELDAAAAKSSGKKKIGPVLFYSLYALGFTALLAKTLIKHPLFPPALDSLSWNNQWLITTVSTEPRPMTTLPRNPGPTSRPKPEPKP